MTDDLKPETAADQPPLEPAPELAPDPSVAPPAPKAPADRPNRPSYVLLLAVAGTSLVADLVTKAWALRTLERTLPNGDAYATSKEINSWLAFVLARNRGGAWGLLQTADEHVRRPFFLLISALAIVFIVSLYRRVHPQQHALKWGLPLVLGGALGNLVDRVRYSWVVDFIDMKGSWVRALNEVIAKIWHSHVVTDHWPTYNVADIAICIGVGLMAIDMFTSRRIVRADAQSAIAAPHGVNPTPPLTAEPPPPAPQPPESAA